ncbi:CDP-glycerol glycerophosphotransferase family protein [Psychrobacter cibarius]|uniref:CDP-glycerol glycerophosphotransferase family protein n=1 Tax=Psychrobacter cibarius TaxID=282669 RepID=UPI0018DFCDAE|nr:CDP-glycerol glycerophosphotransferase family protein [Psychrobacter cibarius]
MSFKNIIDIAYSSAMFGLSLVTKNAPNFWLFGAQDGYSYSDNSRYFFEWMLEHHASEKCFWVTKDRSIYNELLSQGIPVLYFYDVRNIFCIAKAKFIVCTHSHIGNDVYKFINRSKSLITLWHGIPLKKMGNSPKRKYRRYLNMKDQPDLFLVTSERDAELFNDLYHIDRDKFFIGTYPRVNNLISRADNNKTILYAPTFRDGMGQNYYDKYVFPTLNELHSLNDSLVKIDHRFIVKMHPYVKAEFPDLSGFSNIELVSAFDDVQFYLAQASILITDYSSIYFDYLNLDREIIFFIPDFEWYHQESNRGLLYEYEDVTPGVKLTTWLELESNLVNLISNNNTADFSQNRKEVLDFFYTQRYSDNADLLNACQQVNI